MQFLLLVYIDDTLLDKLPAEDFNAEMRQCLQRSDAMKQDGTMIGFQQLEPAATARSVRLRNGRTTILDGPFAETKEMLAGFSLVEAASMEDAVRLAQELPWTRYGCVEVRQAIDIAAMRARVGA